MIHLFKNIVATAAVALLSVILTGCKDTDAIGGMDLENVRVYMTVSMTQPGVDVTRSTTIDSNDTSSDGWEPGTDAENAIHRLLIVMKHGDDSLCFPVSSSDINTVDGSSTTLIDMPLADIIRMAGHNIELYVLANYNATMLSEAMNGGLNTATLYSLSSPDDPLLKTTRGLPMSGEDKYVVSLPSDLSSYLTEANPLDLTQAGAITLIRSVARIDYLDASTGHDHTFPIVDEADVNKTTGYEVTLASMHLFNVCDRFSAFPQAAANPRGFLKDDIAITTSNLDKCSESETSNYKIWRYITENKLPDDAQIQKNTTGIRFHFRITTTPDGAVSTTGPLTFKAGGRTMSVNYTADDADGAGHYVDYYYFIRHNDNDNPYLTGPMEFSVVRNNIYRLSIESISGLPEPYTPENPDEYPGFKVNVRIAKWQYHKYVFDM